MTYAPRRNNNHGGLARLLSAILLEQAMKARDITGRELARAAGTSAQTVSQLRTGDRLRVRTETARRLERALRVERGSIFCVDSDGSLSSVQPATSLAVAV